MTYRGAPIGRSGHSEQLSNDPRARRNGQIQSVPELDVGKGLEVNNEGRVSIEPASKVDAPARNVTALQANLNPGYLAEHQTTSSIDITGATADSITNLRTATLSVESKLNAALAEIDTASSEHITFYNGALLALQQEVIVLRSLITSLRDGGFIAK